MVEATAAFLLARLTYLHQPNIHIPGHGWWYAVTVIDYSSPPTSPAATQPLRSRCRPRRRGGAGCCPSELEAPMAKFRDVKTLQKFAAVHASIHNHFNRDRHLNRRDIFKQNRSAALVAWHQLAA